MSPPGSARRVASCGLLLLPILAWNAAFARVLPPFGDAAVRGDVPAFVAIGESGLRVAVVALPFLMPLDISTPGQRRGLALFVAGTLIYFAVWLPLLVAPHLGWSTSLAGATAPAYAPILWLVGLGLVGRELYWSIPYRPWIYIALGAAFVSVHSGHAVLVHQRAASAELPAIP